MIYPRIDHHASQQIWMTMTSNQLPIKVHYWTALKDDWMEMIHWTWLILWGMNPKKV
jgi:hypothetical protein